MTLCLTISSLCKRINQQHVYTQNGRHFSVEHMGSKIPADPLSKMEILGQSEKIKYFYTHVAALVIFQTVMHMLL